MAKNKITGLTPLGDKTILTPNIYIASDYSILWDCTTYFYDLQLKLNGKEIKLDQTKFLRHLNAI